MLNIPIVEIWQELFLNFEFLSCFTWSIADLCLKNSNFFPLQVRDTRMREQARPAFDGVNRSSAARE